MRDFSKNLIHCKKNMRHALQQLNSISDNYPKEPLALFAIDDNERIKGALTDGDIRRSLLEGQILDTPVETIINSDFHYLRENLLDIEALNLFKKKNIKMVPVVDSKNHLVQIIDLTKKKSLLPLDAVIMAGGKGKRLRPLTENIPKPLLKIGDKPIIEYNIDRLNQYGIDNLVLSVNYKGDQIINYFGDGTSKNMNISYIQEDQPLGTMGSLSLVDTFYHDHILLMNSDLLTTIDYESFFRDFKHKNADMAVASIPYEVKLPYAVLEVNGERIHSFKEKPEYTYYSNAGIYLFKKDLLRRISPNQYLDVTDFMEGLIKDGKKISYFPLLGYWLDIGRHEDFEKAKKDIRLLEL